MTATEGTDATDVDSQAGLSLSLKCHIVGFGAITVGFCDPSSSYTADTRVTGREEYTWCSEIDSCR